jgi:site-specific recombinase XerD
MDWLNDLRDWVETKRERRISDTTFSAYARDLRAFVQWYEGIRGRPFSPDQVTVADADDWLRDELAKGRKPRTLQCYLAALKLMSEWSTCTGLTPTDCLNDLRPLPNERTQTTAWLDLPELILLFRAVRLFPYWDDEKRAMVDLVLRLLADAGLRIEEVSNLMLDDLDWRRDRLIILVHSTRDERRVRVPQSLEASLHGWLAQRTNKNSPWVISGQRSGRVGPRFLSRLVRTVADWAGLSGVTPQALRLTYHHFLRQKGKNPRYLADILGL